MSFGGVQKNPSSSSVDQTIKAMQEAELSEAVELDAEAVSAKEEIQQAQQETINPFAKTVKQKKFTRVSKSRLEKTKKMGEKGESPLPLQRIKDKAQDFERRNPELKSGVLSLLRERIKPGDTKEEILKKLEEFYTDVSLADEALEFLFETTDGELARTVQDAKNEFEGLHGREISAGKNIAAEARDAASQGLGTSTNLRDMYRNITANPRDSATLFDELSQKYAFKELKKVTDFLLHSLGADMKAKGPSIPRGQLHRLITETRSLQAILGVYRFFKGRMKQVNKMFQKEGLKLPQQISFESLSKQFMGLVSERYPTGEKVLQSTERLGIDKWIQAKIIVLSQLRDAIREVAANQIYRSIQHRDELYMAILEALEDLEDELEELLEQLGENDEEEDEEIDEEQEDETEEEVR